MRPVRQRGGRGGEIHRGSGAAERVLCGSKPLLLRTVDPQSTEFDSGADLTGPCAVYAVLVGAIRLRVRSGAHHSSHRRRPAPHSEGQRAPTQRCAPQTCADSPAIVPTTACGAQFTPCCIPQQRMVPVLEGSSYTTSYALRGRAEGRRGTEGRQERTERHPVPRPALAALVCPCHTAHSPQSGHEARRCVELD